MVCRECGKYFKSRIVVDGEVRNISGRQFCLDCLPYRSHNTPEIVKKQIAEKNTGKKHSEETKRKISELMKERHKKGLAHNIGSSRWNNKPSYPEQFFMRVIENEFEDKNYKREYPVSIYSIDFAWVDKKLAIEIDGEQHERFEEYRERDKRKDIYLIENGWKVLRIDWSDMCNNTKYWITQAKDFVNSGIIQENLEESKIRPKHISQKEYMEKVRQEGYKRYEKLIKKVPNLDIDYSQPGWVNRFEDLTGMRTQKVNKFMRTYMYDFWLERCYKRPGSDLSKIL